MIGNDLSQRVTNAVQYLVRAVDATVARVYLSGARERSALICFLYHSLFRDQREIDLNMIDPLQRTTLDKFRQFIRYYLRNGYQFVTPADVVAGLPEGGKYALITFDDGYFNNTLALPILEEFNVPATFFISTDHVRQNRCFWWDVLFRQRTAQGASSGQIYREAVALKQVPTEEIEARLSTAFGPRAFDPRSDVDRPFSPAELRRFAASPRVHLGNHTAHHAILTNYSPAEIRNQIQSAQQWLTALTGVRPIAVAYPNGQHDDSILDICHEQGLKIGFTVRPEKTRLPLSRSNLMRLGRFATHGDGGHVVTQCVAYRSDFLVYGKFRDAYLRVARGRVAQ